MYNNELTHAWYKGTREQLAIMLSKYATHNSKILDIGCGTGGTIVFLKKKGFKNITGIDNSNIALSYCKKRSIKNVIFGSANNLPFKNQSFDVVICMDVLYHEGVTPTGSVSEFFRVLKRGGLIYLQEPAYNWLKGSHDKAINTRYRFNKKELVGLVKKCDFQVIKCSYFNTIFFLPIFLKRFSESLLHKESSSDVYILPLMINYLLEKALKIENKLLENINLPFGLSLICLAKKSKY